MNLDVARKSFIRIRDVRYVELVNRTELCRKQGVSEALLMAEIMAYQGKYQEAARLYTQAREWRGVGGAGALSGTLAGRGGGGAG